MDEMSEYSRVVCDQSVFGVVSEYSEAFIVHKSKKGLPLETENTLNHENRRLGLTESLHMQHCNMLGCIRPLALA